MNYRSRGFTIVELLVVIVVIGILASISIIAYSGVQQRARNAQTLSAANAYMQALTIYSADNNGQYPTLPVGTNFACVGESYPSDTCYPPSNYSENAALNAALKSVLGNLPMPNTSTSGRLYSGMIYIPTAVSAANSLYRLDGANVAWLVYVLEVSDTSVKCTVGSIATFTGSSFTSNPPSSGQTTSGSPTANATCWVPFK